MEIAEGAGGGLARKAYLEEKREEGGGGDLHCSPPPFMTTKEPEMDGDGDGVGCVPRLVRLDRNPSSDWIYTFFFNVHFRRPPAVEVPR